MAQAKNSRGIVIAAGMAVFFVLVVVAVVASLSTNHSNKESVNEKLMCPFPTSEVAMEICDDGVDTAYLSIGNVHYVPYDQVLQQIVSKKKTWQAKFPTRHIVAMIRTDGNSTRTGILIHYESK